jgi:predicted nucleic acid-binding protein
VTFLVDANVLSEATKPAPEPKLRASGRAMPFKDSLIAATALVHGLTVATRNVHDFQQAGVKVFNPFKELADLGS